MNVVAGFVDCGLCGTKVKTTHNKECNSCCDLRSRISADPKIAIQILQAIDDECMASITNLESLAEYLQNAAENFEVAGKEQLFQILDTAAYRVRNASAFEENKS